MNTLESGLTRLASAFDRLQIRYCVCGVYQPEADIELLAAIGVEDAARLAAELNDEFYADADAIRDSILAGRPLDLVHYASGYRFDVLPLKDAPYPSRRRPLPLSDHVIEIPLASAEDTILNKLAWYRSGGGVSERQWHDIRGIIEIQGDRLVRDYMR